MINYHHIFGRFDIVCFYRATSLLSETTKKEETIQEKQREEAEEKKRQFLVFIVDYYVISLIGLM